MRLRTRLLALASMAALTGVARPAEAFLFPEHSRITQDVLEGLAADPEVARLLQGLIAAPDLCAREGDMNEGDCLRLVADLVAIAGDHTCSPDELGAIAYESNAGPNRQTHWIWDVRRNGWDGDALLNGDSAEERRRLKVIDIQTKGHAVADRTIYRNDRPYVELPVDRAFYRRRINLGFQAVDRDFQSRAIVDSGHFQLARGAGRIDLVEYLRSALAPHSATNATALYATYHVLAMRLAAEAATVTRASARERAFLAELFALHFLEDSFSSGHIVGQHGIDTWLILKSEGVRLGTHDHYSDEGVEAVRWTDLASPYVAHGDGMMKATDLAFAAVAARKSLREVLVALQDPALAREWAARFSGVGPITGAFNACREANPHPSLVTLAIEDGPLNDVLALEPVPSASVPEPQRYRAEAGLFFGGSAAIDGGGATGDGGVGRAHASIRSGVGLTGLTIDPMNSIAFAEVGIVALGTQFGEKTHADAGITFRVRAPGLVTLVDGVVVLGLLGAGFRWPWLIGLGAKAGGGGLLPFLWQSHHLGGSWNFQVSALRDAAFNLYFRGGGQYRWEFQAPILTLRTANPIAGISWAQSNDFWMDVGFTAGRATELSNGTFGFYLAFSASARSFP